MIAFAKSMPFEEYICFLIDWCTDTEAKAYLETSQTS